MGTIAQLLELARLYGAAKGISHWRVSLFVFNDGKKLAALEKGKRITTERLDVAMQWFSDNWPVGTGWPAHIGRQEKQEAAE